MTKPTTIEDYIAGFPPKIRAILRKTRAAIRKAVPGAEERLSYGMPAFFLDGAVAYYAAFKAHIGLFPPTRDAKLRALAATYAGPKGNLRFPLDKPLPYGLIGKIAKARARDNQARKAAKRKPKASSRAGKRR